MDLVNASMAPFVALHDECFVNAAQEADKEVDERVVDHSAASLERSDAAGVDNRASPLHVGQRVFCSLRSSEPSKVVVLESSGGKADWS